MAELKSPTENPCRLSQEEIQIPLSPVLGSGQSLKKLLKNRRERHKRDTNRVAQKLDNILTPQDEIDRNCNSVPQERNVLINDDSMLQDFGRLEESTLDIQAVAGPSKPRLSLEYSSQDMPENLRDRIQILEELETTRSSIIQAISFSKKVNLDTFATISAKSNVKLDRIRVTNDSEVTKDEVFQEYSEEKKADVCPKEVNKIAHFQTCTGKGINISEADMKTSAKLFDDILCPNDGNQSTRKKKFNYLSKYGSPEKGNRSEILHGEPGSTRQCETIFGNSVNSSMMLSESAQIKSSGKNDKNIFEGENFEDLKLLQHSCLKTTPVGLKNVQINNISETEHQEKPPQKYIKKIEDLQLERPGQDRVKIILEEGKFSGCNAASVSSRKDTSKKCKAAEVSLKRPVKNTVNIFRNENFDDLKLSPSSGFKAPSSSNMKLQNRAQGVKNIFEGESFDDLKVPYNSGFQQASTCFKVEKKLNRAEEKVVKSASDLNKPSKNIFEGENFNDLNFIENIGFKPASISLKDLKNCTHSDEKPVEVSLQTRGFKRSLVPEITTLEPAAKRPSRNIFEGENFDDLNINVTNFHGFKTGPGAGCSKADVDKPKGFRNIFEGENFDDLNLGGLGPKFQSPLLNFKTNLLQNRTFESPYVTPVKNIVEPHADIQSDDKFYGFTNEERKIASNISESNCIIVNIIESRFQVLISHQNRNEPFINLSNIENLSRNIYSNKLKLSLEPDLASSSRHFGQKITYESNIKTGSDTPLQKSFLKRPKKRLGCHFSPTIQVSETVLKKARLLFEDLGHRPMETSTPVKFETSLARPLVCDLTPVQGARRKLGGTFLDAGFSRSFNKTVTLDQTLIKNNTSFGLNKPSEGNVKVWMDNLSFEKRRLEEMIRIVNERQTILANQKTMLEFSERGKKRILPGVLYKTKNSQGRILLKELSARAEPEDNSTINFLNQVNPQNAHLVHFYMENKRQSHIQTLDGAVLVPNTEGRIGISEVEHSFKVMECVQPNLIPKGWIQNHYKWIIWKLASYERMFPDKFRGCLCVENVIQQLKYRYDIEIDEAKRSILHKIFEKDDCPQRRLVLCVSKIMRVQNTYDLELTDGWYPIRTVIDPLLSDQVLKGKIKLGVKLVTYGAELMNCDGCHPLEATEQVCLKINFNSTRRAVWWSKLGCQKDSGPFLIPLSSVNMEGGKIGCIQCFIVRVYPIKYMEKYGRTNVWRNRKAEERRQQEIHNEKMKTLERTNNRGYSEHSDNDLLGKGTNRDELKSIRNIDDPETLYGILLKSGDPEALQENLSSSQKTLLYNYTINKSKYSNNFNERAKILEERSVTSLLKIKIVDASCASDTVYDFYVWGPQDSYLQEIREGEVVTIYNVSCSPKWGLSSNRTTQFKKGHKPEDERYQKFRRKATVIGELSSFSKRSQILPEFDTVGIVVKKKVCDQQQIWLTDCQEKLLVINIYDSPKNILVLDGVSEGQIVTVCNLVFKHFSEECSSAVADHSVVFSRYSQYRHLQEAAESLERQLTNRDITALLKACSNKVDKIDTKWDCRNPKQAWDTDDMDCSQITTTDLALLECVDKLT